MYVSSTKWCENARSTLWNSEATTCMHVNPKKEIHNKVEKLRTEFKILNIAHRSTHLEEHWLEYGYARFFTWKIQRDKLKIIMCTYR